MRTSHFKWRDRDRKQSFQIATGHNHPESAQSFGTGQIHSDFRDSYLASGVDIYFITLAMPSRRE